MNDQALNEQNGTERQTKKNDKDSAVLNTEPTLKEKNYSTDSVVDAINELSELQSRWSAPQRKKSRRGRQRKKKNDHSNSTAEASNLYVDATDNGWIDVEDVVKIMDPSWLAKTQKVKNIAKDVDGVEIIDLPPQKSEDEEEKNDIMYTSELKSYADVLKRALENVSKIKTNSDDDSEMDISDYDESSIDAAGQEIINSFSSETIEKKTPDQTAAAKDQREKEKRALKLAELKAKAKLANAKLRMATTIQRKALGNIAKEAQPSLADGRNTLVYDGVPNRTKRPWHAANSSGLSDISALRNIPNLIIPDVSLTGSDEMVRFIDSVYNQSSEDDYSSEDEDADVALPECTPGSEAALPSESQKKPNRSLKQQLHLAKLRLEIKKKEQLLLEKKRKGPDIPTATESKLSSIELPSKVCLLNASEECIESSEGKSKFVGCVSDVMISLEEKRVQLEQLRRRQKELKHKNEVSNLKNLINRQRQLLCAQGQELSESSAQLENVMIEILSKQNLLDESKKRLEEMNHRKRIMEGIMLKATDKVMTARKALNQHKQQSVTN